MKDIWINFIFVIDMFYTKYIFIYTKNIVRYAWQSVFFFFHIYYSQYKTWFGVQIVKFPSIRFSFQITTTTKNYNISMGIFSIWIYIFFLFFWFIIEIIDRVLYCFNLFLSIHPSFIEILTQALSTFTLFAVSSIC